MTDHFLQQERDEVKQTDPPTGGDFPVLLGRTKFDSGCFAMWGTDPHLLFQTMFKPTPPTWGGASTHLVGVHT